MTPVLQSKLSVTKALRADWVGMMPLEPPVECRRAGARRGGDRIERTSGKTKFSFDRSHILHEATAISLPDGREKRRRVSIEVQVAQATEIAEETFAASRRVCGESLQGLSRSAPASACVSASIGRFASFITEAKASAS